MILDTELDIEGTSTPHQARTGISLLDTRSYHKKTSYSIQHTTSISSFSTRYTSTKAVPSLRDISSICGRTQLTIPIFLSSQYVKVSLAIAQHCFTTKHEVYCRAIMPSFLAILAGIIAVTAVSIYLFGIPPELKRKMERTALKTMGENKASYLVKGISFLAQY
jgi:hypothetical protein